MSDKAAKAANKPVYRIMYKKSVGKELRKLDGTQLRALVRQIEALATDPRPAGCIRLQDSDGLYRVRQGDYRIIYGIRDEVLVVLVVKVGHRKEVYDRR